MKTLKYLKYIFTLGLLASLLFTSCNPEENLGDPPRLFRPIASLENQGNNIVAKWDNIKGATSYDLELFIATGNKDDNGDDIFTSYRKVSVESTPYIFEDVEWDEKYKLTIKAVGENIESKEYETTDLSIVYITNLSNSRTIDNAVLVMWKTDGVPFTAFVIISENGGDETIVELTQAEFELGEKTVWNLDPETSYILRAYSGEEQTGDTYQGRLKFTTKAPEDYDAIFGAGKWLDLRGNDDPDVLKNEFSQIKEYEAIILEGGFEYKVNNQLIFESSMTFVTGLSLAGNAVFVQSGGFQATGNVGKVKFEKIDFISDKAYALPISETTDKGFGGRQVYNVNGSNSTLNELIFKDCRIEGYRAIVRLQGDTDGVKNLTFNACTINGIGDQAVVTTNNKSGAIMENITFTNTTILNIVLLADLRASATPPKFLISDCTFCYAPMETSENANTPLFRFLTNPVELTITNTIFGPSMASVGGTGGELITYNPGPKGSVFLNGENSIVGVGNSYKTNFTWTSITEKTYPLEGLNTISIDEEGLFQDPTEENFSIIYNFDGAKNSGAVKWRMP